MLNLLKRVLRAVRPGKTEPEPARARRFPKRYEPMGIDEDGYPVYSREDMLEMLEEALAVRREAVRLEAEERAKRLALEQAELNAVAEDAVTEPLLTVKRRRL